MEVILVALGSAAGGCFRYGLGRLAGGSPWMTCGINVAGSFLIGVLAATCLRPEAPRREWFLLLGVGLCGGFTTFSAFSKEAVEMLRDGANLKAAGYVLASVLASLAAAYGGWRLGAIR